MKTIIEYKELRKILTEQCCFAKDVRRFQRKYENDIKALSFKEMSLLENIMEIQIECDNYCI